MSHKVEEKDVDPKGKTNRPSTRKAAVTIPYITESNGSRILREKNKRITGRLRRRHRRRKVKSS